MGMLPKFMKLEFEIPMYKIVIRMQVLLAIGI